MTSQSSFALETLICLVARRAAYTDYNTVVNRPIFSRWHCIYELRLVDDSYPELSLLGMVKGSVLETLDIKNRRLK